MSIPDNRALDAQGTHRSPLLRAQASFELLFLLELPRPDLVIRQVLDFPRDCFLLPPEVCEQLIDPSWMVPPELDKELRSTVQSAVRQRTR